MTIVTIPSIQKIGKRKNKVKSSKDSFDSFDTKRGKAINRKPMAREPLSPMKSFAFGKLKKEKPEMAQRNKVKTIKKFCPGKNDKE